MDDIYDLKNEPLLEKCEQIDIAAKLQSRLLQTYLRKLEDGTLSDTGLASLQRLLQANGWSLDENALPQGLKSKLTKNVPSTADLDSDDGVLPFRRPA